MAKGKKILKGAEIISAGLYFKKEGLLAVGDMHIGKEEDLNKEGILIPRTNFNAIMSELKHILKKTGKVKTIVLLGDVKHEFGLPSNQEWREIVELFEFLEKRCGKIVLLKGNHDNYIKPLAEWKGVELANKYFTNGLLFAHGNKIISSRGAEAIVIGHEHPAITLSDEHKREKFKCFVKTEFRGKDLVVLPSLYSLSFGKDMRSKRFLSPYLKNLKEFECWVLEKRKVFYFGKIRRKE